MTDLEITRLCAVAMGYTIRTDHVSMRVAGSDGLWCNETGYYHPLDCDAQAMALVKKFPMDIHGPMDNSISRQGWYAHILGGNIIDGQSKDLNRAICECVAKMRLAESKNREPSPDFDTQGG